MLQPGSQIWPRIAQTFPHEPSFRPYLVRPYRQATSIRADSKLSGGFEFDPSNQAAAERGQVLCQHGDGERVKTVAAVPLQRAHAAAILRSQDYISRKVRLCSARLQHHIVS